MIQVTARFKITCRDVKKSTTKFHFLGILREISGYEIIFVVNNEEEIFEKYLLKSEVMSIRDEINGKFIYIDTLYTLGNVKEIEDD